jgi:putative aminopeptidase
MLCGVILLLARPAWGQQGDSALVALATRLASIQAVTGYEQALVDTVLALLPGGHRDRAGNARFELGGGHPKRLLVCPLDEPGYVVGNIRDDGYLTLRRVPGHTGPLFDQQLEGQRVTIQGRTLVPGVVAVRSIHLTRGRVGPGELPFTVDDAYVDVGASTRAQVSRLGIRILSPVTLAKRPQRYGNDLLAAPSVGRRTACAAVLLAIQQSRVRSKLLPPVIIAFVVEQELSQRGIGTVANELGPLDETVLVDANRDRSDRIRQKADSTSKAQWPGLGQVSRWTLPVRYGGTPVETVAMRDADSLRAALVRWIGGQ